MKNKVLSGIVYLVFGVLLAFGPYSIFPVCKSSMMAMRCQDTAKAELVLGILTIAVGVLMLLIKNRKLRIGLNIAAMPIGILAFLFPNNITGVCSNVHMTCRSLTLPVLGIIGIALVVFADMNTVYLWRFASKGEVYDGICIDFK